MAKTNRNPWAKVRRQIHKPTKAIKPKTVYSRKGKAKDQLRKEVKYGT